MTPQTSNIIRWLRWPLLVGMINAHISGGWLKTWMWMGAAPEWFERLFHLMHWIVSMSCTYGLLLISGYLFFANSADHWSLGTYWAKIKRRLLSIALPYIAWNLIALAYKWVLCVPQIRAVVRPSAEPDEVGWAEFWHGLWDFGVTQDGMIMPIDHPLWYLRVLLILCLLAPVFYWAIKSTGPLLPCVLGVCMLCQWWPQWLGYLMRAECPFYFALGAYMALRWNERVSHGWVWPLVWGLTVAAWWLWPMLVTEQLCTLAGALMILWLGWCAVVCWHIPMPAVLTASAFVLYALHNIIIDPAMSVAYRLVGGEAWWQMALYLLVGVLILTAVCAAFDMALRRYLPRLHGLLTGKR